MKKSKVLAIFIGGYLTIASSLQNALPAHPPEKQTTKHITERITEQTDPLNREKTEQKLAGYPEHVKANYYSILAYIQETTTDYIGKARRVSSGLEHSIKKHGIAKIIAMRNKSHASRLDLALERINQRMPEKEFGEKARQISKEYYENARKTNVSAPIDFAREIVIQAGQKNIMSTALFYERLLNSHPKANPGKAGGPLDYKQLVESAFSEKEYSELILERLAAIDKIYDALLKSRVGFKGLFAASGINKMRKFEKEYYEEQAQKIHASKNKDGIPNPGG